MESGPHFRSPSFLSGSRQPPLLSGSLQFPEFLPEQILEYRDPFALGVQPSPLTLYSTAKHFMERKANGMWGAMCWPMGPGLKGSLYCFKALF